MQTTQGTMLQSLRAAKRFIDEHADRLAVVIDTGARKRLDDAIAALEGHASDQTGSALASKGLTQKQRAQRVTLMRDHMRSISRIAKADLPATPEFAPLRMPRGKPTIERLAAAAAGMAQVAAEHPDVFTKAGMPQDFLAQLNSSIGDMVGAVTARTEARGKGRGATAGLKQKLSEGRKIVHILDAFIQSALKDEPALLANWNLVKRVPKQTGGAANRAAPPAAPAPSEPAAPAPTPAPVPAPVLPTSI